MNIRISDVYVRLNNSNANNRPRDAMYSADHAVTVLHENG